MLLTRQGAPSLIEDKRRTFTLWSKAPGVQHTAPKFCVCGQVQKDFRERDAPKRKRWTPNRTYTTTSAEARDSIYSLSLCPRPRRDIMLPRTKLIGSARRLLRRTPEYDVNESALAHRHADARRAGSWAPPTSRFATHARQDRGAPDPESTCVRHPPPHQRCFGRCSRATSLSIGPDRTPPQNASRRPNPSLVVSRQCCTHLAHGSRYKADPSGT